MVIKALNVAEKPSVAKEVSRALSNGAARSRRGRSRFNPIWEFHYTISGTQCDMQFTSVAGHLMQLDFTATHKRWHSCNPLELYRAPVVKQVPEDKRELKEHLEQLARQCQWLVLWLDCDREGENIGFEVMDVCLGANRHLRVLRARFSALVASELAASIQRLVPPNAADAAAVDARQEIDLRVGASFTRLQTLLLQSKFDWLAGGLANDKPLLSYGPCQFPTLGLIVQRSWEIQSHVSEPFWYIHVAYRPAAGGGGAGGQQQQGAACEFKWARERLFDGDMAALLYEAVTEEEPITATVMQVQGRVVTRRAPVPLATLEMCKRAGTQLRMSGERIMKMAEELYQGGFISYPRTETDVYDPAMDLRSLIQQQTPDARWGSHASAIMDGSMWQPPRAGGHDDKAHPPIHPTRSSPGEGDWSPEKRSLYEFIVRYFLASCSKDAVGQETNVTIDIAGEAFRTTGLMVTERNWLLVCPWVSWGGNANLPHFVEGMTFTPSEVSLREGATQPPPRLLERDLIAAMERYGIGTDATVAEHIQKQLDRGYAVKDAASLTFSATPLGECLISGYRRMGLDNLWKPDLRGRIEAGINRIAAGTVTKDTILTQALTAFEADFQAALQRTQDMLTEVGRFFTRIDGGGGQQQGGGPGGGWGGGGPGGPGGGPGGGGGGGGGPGPGGGHGPHPGNGFGPPGPGPAAAAASQQQPPGHGPPGGPPHQGQAVPLGACPRCGGLLMLTPPPPPPPPGGGSSGSSSAASGPPRVACQGDLPCSFRFSLPRCVAGAAVSGQQCGRCTHGQVMKVTLSLRMGLLPPGLFHEPEYTGCLVCDGQLKQLIEITGPSRAPPAAAAADGGYGAGGGGSFAPQQQQHQQQQQPPGPRQQQQQQPGYGGGGGAARERTMIPPAAPASSQMPGSFNDWGTSQAAKTRKEGGGRTTTKRSASGGSKGTKAGRGQGSRAGRGRGAAAAAAAGGGNGPPCCPNHGEPVRVVTSKSAANPGRVFYKCSRPPEEGGEECLKFAWADEFQGGPAGAAAGGGRGGGGRGSGSSSRGRGGAKRGARGSSQAGGGGQFVAATGEHLTTCYRCHQVGHFASNCPN